MKSLYSCRILILLFLLAVFTNDECVSQNFHLVKDINSITNADPSNYNYRFSTSKKTSFPVLNGISYFAANDGVNGTGLWRSDGTDAGTYQVKDSVNPSEITVSNGKLFFIGTGATGLWISDGTEAGTVSVLTTPPPGLNSFYPASLTDFNGALFFVISSNGPGNQLWKTDGTSAGTVLVRNFYHQEPDKSLGNLANLTVIKKKLYFRANTNIQAQPFALLASDGTTLGTHVITKDIREPAQMIAATSNNNDSLVYLTGLAAGGNRLLYITNGDSANAAIAPGFTGAIYFNYYEYDLINIGGVIYFAGRINASETGLSLCKYDINATEKTQLVKIVAGTNALGGASMVSDISDVNGTLYFNVYDAPNNKNQVWKSDGSSGGNVLLKDSVRARYFFGAGGQIYFSGEENLYGGELWKTDGSANGTSIVKDINAGPTYSSPLTLTYVNGKVIFAAQDGVRGNELWQSNGTTEGTTLVKDINQTSSLGSNPFGLKAYNNILVFGAGKGGGNPGLNVSTSDGTESGTRVSDNAIYIAGSISDHKFSVRNNQVYFAGFSAAGKRGLHKMDVVTGETSLLKDFANAPFTTYATIVTDSLVYFPLQNGATGRFELWRTDGTASNTFAVKTDFFNFDNPFISLGNTLFFVPQNSNALWKTDGTIPGTVLVKTFDYAPYNLYAFNGTLFFAVYDPASSGLWKSDGTSGGTMVVTTDLKMPENFIASGGELFFTAISYSAPYGQTGAELFKTDGTKNGTVLVKDIRPGSFGTPRHKSISLNGILYFFMDAVSTSSLELWKSDGTTGGTQFISTVGSGGGNFKPTELVACNGKLFFVFRSVLWESDGTQQGTHPVADIIFSDLTISTFGTNLAVAGNKLFFTASNYKYGKELYASNFDPAAIIYYFSVADGNWSNPAIWADNVVPPEGADVIIKNAVTVNVNVTCNSLLVEPGSNLTVNPGIILTVLH